MTERDPSLATILPHSYPFILIDKIIGREEDKAIVCLKNITFNEYFFQGHFRDNPVMPGVLIIEAMAQASGLIIGSAQTARVFLSRVKDARFKKQVVPGDQLVIKSRVIQVFSPLYVFETGAYVRDTIVAEAEITLSIA